MGNSGNPLISSYFNYNTNSEASGDSKGTSIAFDLTYHTLALLYGDLMMACIMVGGFYMGYMYIDVDPEEAAENSV